MQVGRIGSTPVKGGRHQTHESVRLELAGPVGDRVFCLVDPTTSRCLRTVENPTLLQASTAWDGVRLEVELPTGTYAGEPVPTGEVLTVDYWGRATDVEIVAGPWAAAYSAHLGRDVRLARSRPGDIVYGHSVTLVTSASLAALSAKVGVPVDGARFRATFELVGDGLRPDEEAGWVGRRLQIGTAELRVRGLVPRCAVIDLDPAAGVRDLAVLKALEGDLAFGVDAEVIVAGDVVSEDAATL